MRFIHDGSAEFTEILERARVFAPSYVTVGVFDGVHRGHQQLIGRMVEAGHALDNSAVAIVFNPHPAMVLGHEPLPLLTTVEERGQYLASLGLDALVVLPFTPALSRTGATDFVEALISHLHLVELWGGPDLALGYRRQGDVSSLRSWGVERGFQVRVVQPLTWEGAPVTSSRVRRALKAGDISQATGCLGRPYRLAGVVVHGDGRGHRIGVPTANLAPPQRRLIPARGIYACRAHTEHHGTHPAVTSIGIRPTFDEHTLTVETHLLEDFEADLYGQVLALDFVARLRDEYAFPSAEDLVKQIHMDIAQARRILSEPIDASPVGVVGRAGSE